MTPDIRLISPPKPSVGLWARKVGKTPLARLAWLLRFARMQVPTAKKELKQVDDELSAFMALSGVSAFSSCECNPESIKEIRDDLLRQLRLVGKWGSLPRWWVPLDGLAREVGKGFISGYRNISPPPSLHRLFMVNAAELVGSPEGKRIEVCARQGCDRLFVRRKRGLYCGRACSQKEQTRKYRERYNEMRRRWDATKGAPKVRKTNALPKENV